MTGELELPTPRSDWTEDQWYEWCEAVHRKTGITPGLRQAWELYKANYALAARPPSEIIDLASRQIFLWMLADRDGLPPEWADVPPAIKMRCRETAEHIFDAIQVLSKGRQR